MMIFDREEWDRLHRHMREDPQNYTAQKGLERGIEIHRNNGRFYCQMPPKTYWKYKETD